MPRGDGTGPMAMGRMTGRGAGFCAGIAASRCANPVAFVGGFRRGFSRGRGSQRMFCAAVLPGWRRYEYPAYAGVNGEACTEKEILSNHAEFLENQLQQVKSVFAFEKM